jgi:hypothetical protein
MFQGYRIVAVTPAGRRRYLEVLLPNLLAQRPLVDEYQLWLNCYDERTGRESIEDLEYCQDVKDRHPDFVTLIPPKPKEAGRNPHMARSRTIHHFFRDCTNPRTIYVRFDDDIVFIAPDALRELMAYRIGHPSHFLVFANIINNAVTSHLHQRMGALDDRAGIATYACMCATAWRNPLFAEHVHRTFLAAARENALEKYRFREWILRGRLGPTGFRLIASPSSAQSLRNSAARSAWTKSVGFH